MPCHRSRVAQAKIDVSMSINIEEVSALRLANERRKCSGPLDHPVHGNASQEGLARPFKERLRLGTIVDKLLLFALHQGLQAAAINGFHREKGKPQLPVRPLKRHLGRVLLTLETVNLYLFVLRYMNP